MQTNNTIDICNCDLQKYSQDGLVEDLYQEVAYKLWTTHATTFFVIWVSYAHMRRCNEEQNHNDQTATTTQFIVHARIRRRVFNFHGHYLRVYT